MIEKLLEKTPLENKAEMKEKIKKIINRTKDDFLFEIQEIRENRQSLIASKLIKIKAHSL